ncbi:MAG: STAS domain-containing protein [Tepidisphaeraceae bacterium]
MGQLQMDVAKTPRGVVARFDGEAGLEQGQEMERHMSLLAQLPPGLLVIDLSNLIAISSVGFGLLIRYRNELETAGGRMKLASLRPQVMDAFRHAKLDKLFEIHPTVDAAVGN